MVNFEWKIENRLIVLYFNGIVVAKQVISKYQLTIQCTSIFKKWDFIVFDGSLSDFTKKEIENYISSQMWVG